MVTVTFLRGSIIGPFFLGGCCVQLPGGIPGLRWRYPQAFPLPCASGVNKVP